MSSKSFYSKKKSIFYSYLVAIIGTQITLWCSDLRSNSKFKVVIGEGNDIEKAKEKKQSRFDEFASDELKLWRVNTPQINSETLNEELKDAAQKIGVVNTCN